MQKHRKFHLQSVIKNNESGEKSMKQPKRLTREQKMCLTAHHLNAKNWSLVEETDFYLKVINKVTGTRRSLDKFIR